MRLPAQRSMPRRSAKQFEHMPRFVTEDARQPHSASGACDVRGRQPARLLLLHRVTGSERGGGLRSSFPQQTSLRSRGSCSGPAGKLDLDRPLMTYLPGPYRHVQNPFAPGVSDVVTDPRFGRITARMVLSHTSGLPNWSRHQPLALSSEPGTTWSYSGEGYVFLQQVVETIAGQDLQRRRSRGRVCPARHGA